MISLPTDTFSVTVRFGHLDYMPRCKVCDRALCSHSDAEFQGVAPIYNHHAAPYDAESKPNNV
jgi:hypothetical protein